MRRILITGATGIIDLTAAQLMEEFETFQNPGYDITGTERKIFAEAAGLLTELTGRKIRYVSPVAVRFYLKKRRDGVPAPMIFVVIMLHVLPRSSKKRSETTDTVKKVPVELPAPLKRL